MPHASLSKAGKEMGGGIKESDTLINWSREKEFETKKPKTTPKTKGSGLPTSNKYSNDLQRFPVYKES